MRPFHLIAACAIALLTPIGYAQQASAQQAGSTATAASSGPYHVLRVAKVGGDGGFDYVYADSDSRQLYVARRGGASRISVYNLDTLALVTEIPNVAAHGVASDTSTHHAFASSNPVAMWDTKTLALIKSIPVDGNPDGILNDTFNHHTYILSHSAPNVTVLDDATGAVLGTIDLGGAPEQAAADGKGRLYDDIEDQGSVAVVDAKSMKLITTYGLNGKGAGNAGLALDAKNHVLFVACRDPQVMVMLDADSGKYLADLPIGRGCDGAAFNPKTREAFASFGDGTLSVIKENSPTSFAVEQVVQTMPGAKTITLDSKTGHVFLIAAEYAAPAAPSSQAPAGAPPTGGPGGGRGRRAMLPGSFSIIEVGK